MDKHITKTTVTRFTGPFPKEHQLDDSLIIVDNQICRRLKGTKAYPNNEPPSLPGHPTLYLNNEDDNLQNVAMFLRKEFITPKLNIMAPRLWLLATPNHSYISPLHEQIVRGRRIIITEDPDLHLTWIDDRVFIKPIPAYLLSHAFWEKYLTPTDDPTAITTTSSCPPLTPLETHLPTHNLLTNPNTHLHPSILGYLRTYTYLIRHESDHNLAKSHNLIPKSTTHAQLLRFLSNFTSPRIPNDHVTTRYHYGQLRLSRLNLWAKFFLGRWHFEKVHWQYWQYFQTFYGPLLFIFAVFTVCLSAMQVGVSVEGIAPGFVDVSLWFSVGTLVGVGVVTVVLGGLFVTMGFKEVVFAVRLVLRKRWGRRKGGSRDGVGGA